MKIFRHFLLVVLGAICLLYTALCVPGHSWSKLYIGEENGSLMVGMETKVYYSDKYLGFEIRSLGLKKNSDSVGFNPDRVLYTFIGGNDIFEYKHECTHMLDRYALEGNSIFDSISLKARF